MDVQALVQQVDLMALAQAAGANFDGRHRSRCPLHQGDNPHAFHVYQRDGGGWRWHCFTGCQAGGDAVEFVKHWLKTDFMGAVAELQRRVGVTPGPGPAARAAEVAVREEVAAPGGAWQQRAMGMIAYAQDQLWMNGDVAMAYLENCRGLTEDSVRLWGLGWNPRDWWDDPARWGLEGGKKVWLPRGLVIPGWRNDELWYVKIRRPLGDDMVRYGLAEPGPVALPGVKYAGVRGCKQTLFGASQAGGRATLVVVEGEFDAILLHQVASDLVDVVTLGGASTQLTMDDLLMLARYRRVVAAQDNDEAGETARQRLAALGERVVVSPPPGHDVTEAWRAGVDIRAWVEGVMG